MRTLPMVALVAAVPLTLAGAGLAHPHLLTAETADRWATLHIVLLPGDALGYAGAYAFAAATVAASLALLLRYGMRTLPGSLVLVAASYSFMDSHIFWPRGVVTMLALAAGFTLIAIAATTPAATPLLRPRPRPAMKS